MVARRPSPPNDERSIKGERLNELEQDTRETNAELQALRVGAADRLASYRRVRIGR